MDHTGYRVRSWLCCCAVALLTGSVHAELIFESALSGPTGTDPMQGQSVDADFFVAVNFEVTEPVEARSFGGHIIANSSSTGCVFAALVALDGPEDAPDEPDLSGDDVVAVSLVEPPTLSDNVVGNRRVVLEPGWYAVVMGSGRFGATGAAGATINNVPNGSSMPYALRQSDGAVIPLGVAVRLFVDTLPVARLRVVARTGDSIPDSVEVFEGFSPPSIRAGEVAFVGHGPFGTIYQRGVYLDRAGRLDALANLGTPINPKGETLDTTGTSTSVSAGEVAFRGGAQGLFAVYVAGHTGVTLIADMDTPIPGGTGLFDSFWTNISIHHGTVAFTAIGSDGEQGVFRSVGGQLEAVADLSTPIPEGVGTFEVLPLSFVSVDHDRVTFLGASENPLQIGLYTDRSGALDVLVNLETPIPDGTGNFGFFADAVLRRGHVVFGGADAIVDPEQIGVYTDRSGELTAIANQDTLIPDGQGTFATFLPPAFNGRRAAFAGRDGRDNTGVYSDWPGELVAVLTPGDRVGEQVVDSAIVLSNGMDPTRIACFVRFDDDTEGVVVAAYPAPEGDVDDDGDVDLADYAAFTLCQDAVVSDPKNQPCGRADSDGDTLARVDDFGRMAPCLSDPDALSPCLP